MSLQVVPVRPDFTASFGEPADPFFGALPCDLPSLKARLASEAELTGDVRLETLQHIKRLWRQGELTKAQVIHLISPYAKFDAHCDTPLHNMALAGDGDPGAIMRAFLWTMRVFSPRFGRAITTESLGRERRGGQIMGIVTQGLPPFFETSFEAYTRLAADWPSEATRTPLNRYLFERNFMALEIQKHPDRLAYAPDSDAMLEAALDNKIGIQFGIEGGFPLLLGPGDYDAMLAMKKQLAEQGIPLAIELPTREQVATEEGRVSYMAKSGVKYIGLAHLNSSPYAGTSGIGADRQGSGMTPAGFALVKTMARYGIAPDLAHLSEAAADQLLSTLERDSASLPPLHSHAYMGDGWRGMSPGHVTRVGKLGGCIGVIETPRYIDGGPAAAAAMHQQMATRAGVGHIGFGTDGDGFVELFGGDVDTTIEEVDAELEKRGDVHVPMYNYGNWLRYFDRVEQRHGMLLRRQRLTHPSVGLEPRR